MPETGQRSRTDARARHRRAKQARPATPASRLQAAWRRRAVDALSALAFAVLLSLAALVLTLVAGDSGQRASSPELEGGGTGVAMDGGLRLSGRGLDHAVGLLRPVAAAQAPGRPRLLVWLARDPARAVWLEAPGWRSRQLRFFAPQAEEGLMPAAY